MGRHNPARQAPHIGTSEVAIEPHYAPCSWARRNKTKSDWEEFGIKYLEGRRVILHTDKARSYRLPIRDCKHDVVIHKKKRSLRRGKVVWLRPKFVRLRTHNLPGGVRKKFKAGTQIIDRTWKFLKYHLGPTTSAQPGTHTLAARIRAAQWHYWNQNEDLWAKAAVVVKKHMATMIRDK